MFKLIVATTFILVSVFPRAASSQDQKISRHVYMLISSGIPHQKGRVVQTGFRMQGTEGIITALHGVLGATEISAINDRGDSLTGLRIRYVDIDNDVALLVSPELVQRPNEGLTRVEVSTIVPGQELRVYGHPAGIDIYEKRVSAANPVLKRLMRLIPLASAEAFATRKSPFEGIDVLNIHGNLVIGDSGAPVLDSKNQVVGVVDGGVLGGAAAISWAIPIQSIVWRDVSLAQVRIRELQNLDSRDVFAFQEYSGSAPSSRPSRTGAIVKNSIGMEFGYVPRGSFMMGSTGDEVQAAYEYSKQFFPDSAYVQSFSRETPRHRVTIQEGLYIGRYEVTQAQWVEVMSTNPSSFKGNNLPVETVSWNDTQEFIRRLNSRDDDYTYRLPTEAEWEYACRAGTTTRFAFGDSLSSEQANFNGNYPYGGAARGAFRQTTVPVGTFQPNAWGLYDMEGNVWEWCEDLWHESYYGAPINGTAWLTVGPSSERVLRGGAWNFVGVNLRCSNRFSNEPSRRDNNAGGFRIVAVART